MARRAGLTLVEVLVAAILSGLIVLSLATAFALTIHHEQTFGQARRTQERQSAFEDELRNLLREAVFTDNDGQTTFFVGQSVSGDASISDQLSFTVLGKKVSSVAMANSETDFSERNRTLGPVGGVTEYQLSMTPVGDAGSQQGLFLRRQTPADNEPTSGGFESLLNGDVRTLQFEFWDSTAWIATWNASEEGRLPEAVRITYSLVDDEQSHVLTVRLPNAQGAPIQ